MDCGPEWISEAEIAKALGIPRAKVREARPDRPAAERRHKQNAVFWRKKTARVFAASIGLPGLLPVEPAPPVEPETLTVASRPNPALNGRHTSNPRLIYALRANGERVVVRVADSAKYRPLLQSSGKPGEKAAPMTLQAVKHPDGSWWTLVGKEPRWPGKW